MFWETHKESGWKRRISDSPPIVYYKKAKTSKRDLYTIKRQNENANTNGSHVQKGNWEEAPLRQESPNKTKKQFLTKERGKNQRISEDPQIV